MALRTSFIRALAEMALVMMVIILAMVVIALADRPSNHHQILWRSNLVRYVPTNEKIAALTFDDGPHPTFTPRVLRILDKYHIKATFFMIGNRMEKYPDVVKDVVDHGHVIGNHTYTHPRNMDAISEPSIIHEIDRCDQVIEQMTGKRTVLFRPPRGIIDATVFTIAEEEGYRTIIWTVSADHHDAPTPQAMADRVFRHMRPGGIILVHDGRSPGRWKDVAAAPLIIEGLLSRGYRFLTIPELLDKGPSAGSSTLSHLTLSEVLRLMIDRFVPGT